MRTILTDTGRLRENYLPAVYFDSSVLIDYWMTESMEEDEFEAQQVELEEMRYGSGVHEVRKLLRSDGRLGSVVEIRKRLLSGGAKATPVMSLLGMLELAEWHAEAVFKNSVAEITGVPFIQRKSKKDIGDYIKKALELQEVEKAELGDLEEREEDPVADLVRVSYRRDPTYLEGLLQSMWLNLSFAESHGLRGILFAPIVSFDLPPDAHEDDSLVPDPFIFAYLQLGLADIMHILVAHHLGCQYFAGFDTDFRRAKDDIKKETGLITLTSPEEILSIL